MRSSSPLIKIRALLVVVLLCVACSPPPMDDLDLLIGIEAFEQRIAGQPRDVVQRLLRVQAEEFKGRLITVEGAVVASTYLRDNPSHIYFGVNYDEHDHLFLSEIDPPLHELLVEHRCWVSVVKTYPSRQLSYELPVTEDIYDRLEHGGEVSFTFRVAALIRGRSVYCAPTDLELVF